uniref:Neprosin PEP catalytic domain-containing protein n=1 Tax=Kalanchoe fedtschenkoi TaxID=63787 RepID=A0A7N0U5J5_KALFE
MSKAKHLDALLLILTITFSCFTSSFSSIETTESPAQVPEESLLPMHEGTVKTIYAENGEIIDCVPLAEDIVTEYGECPEGTVPRLRMPHTDEDFFRSMKRLPRSITRNVTQADHDPNDAREYAIVYTEYGAYYGGAAHISIWKPYIERANEFSLAQMWVASGLVDTEETIECGWHVYPDYYKDKNKLEPKLFVYWAYILNKEVKTYVSQVDSYKKTGGYNLKCPGFNQISRKILPGASILTPSQVNGAKSAIDVQIARGCTQMGSGFFPREGASKAAHFHTLKVITNPEGGLFGDPPGQLRPYKTNSKWYDLIRNTYGRPFNGANFLFGGFGRSSSCP